MERKIAVFVFSDKADAFSHAMLNALDMFERNLHVRIVLDGKSTRVLKSVGKTGNTPGFLLSEAVAASLVDCVCHSCAASNKTLSTAIDMNLPLTDPSQGHPCISDYISQGYEILTF